MAKLAQDTLDLTEPVLTLFSISQKFCSVPLSLARTTTDLGMVTSPSGSSLVVL